MEDFVDFPAGKSRRDAAFDRVEHLPDRVSWDDIMYEPYVKQKIEAGLKAVEEGCTVPHGEVKRRLPDAKR